MITEIYGKIRALVEDFPQTMTDVFNYTTSNTFTLSESKNVTISDVKINGNELTSGQTYDYDSSIGKITITANFNIGDIITVDYSYNCFSDSELAEYIKASLVWISYCEIDESDYEIEEDDIYPTPDNRTTDLIAIISSIIIKPNYSSYRLPNLNVTYPRTMSKEDKIQKLIKSFYSSLGISDTIQFDN